MSLNHSKYLRTLPSETRQVAKFYSASTQDQINEIREHIRDLYAMVEKLLDLHEKEHGILERDPITAEIIPVAKTDQSTTTTTKPAKSRDHNPYL